MSKVKDAKQAGGPDPASVLMGLTVTWNMYGFATGFLREGLEGRSDPCHPLSYALNAAIAVFAPLAGSGKGWAAQTSTVLGVLLAAWSAIGVFFMSDRETEMAPWVPGIAGPGLAAALGVLPVVFDCRAREE